MPACVRRWRSGATSQAATATAAGSCTTPPAPPTTPAKLLFSSEFDTSADFSTGPTKKWNTSWPFGSGVNSAASPGEVEIYVDPQNGDTTGPNPFTQGQSMVCITATPTAGLPEPFTYTSGVLSTAGIFSFQYGYAEVACMAPKGSGFWPNFWMVKWTGSWFNVVWPPEIDIFQFSSRFNEFVLPVGRLRPGHNRGTIRRAGRRPLGGDAHVRLRMDRLDDELVLRRQAGDDAKVAARGQPCRCT